jgi:hypothetical protein
MDLLQVFPMLSLTKNAIDSEIFHAIRRLQ